ncbi:MAG: hypothetical protein JRN45_00335 [Nitrososphaerota archaeon]|nr:hypothetical protein [Nitrososphaerota archaeon]
MGRSEAKDSVDYLLTTAKSVNTTDTLVCEFSNNRPMKLDLRLDDRGSRIHRSARGRTRTVVV